MDESEKIDLHAEPPSRSRQWAGRWLLLIIAGLPALATVLAFAGPWWPALDLLAHLRVQYALILCVAVVGAMFIRQWRLALLMLLPATINLALILPLYVHPRWFESHAEFISPQADRGPVLKMMSYVMSSGQSQSEELLELIRNAPSDVIHLQGVTPELLEHLEYAVAPFRVIYSRPAEDDSGQALLVRVVIRSPLTIRDAKSIALDGSEDPNVPQAVRATINWHGREVTLLALQAVSPLSSHREQTQDKQFEDLARWVREQPEPVIVIGNLNTTPWSYRFRRLLGASGLQNSQLGFGIQGTWPATGGSFGQLPLDHCLLSPSLMAVSRQLGPCLTSSHHALLVDIQWSGGASPMRPAEPSYDELDESLDAAGGRGANRPQLRGDGDSRPGWRRRRRRPVETTQPAQPPVTQPAQAR